ncbi:MAG: hypothetical protein FJ304_20845 [Planctomycetes bacterium]|nr:hypothetical protein [Planctomycetota bacterium]
MRWRDLPPDVRAVAVHEAGHGVMGELLGWRVRFLRLDDAGGLCRLTDAPPAPWVDLVVSAAGHAAERSLRGRVRGGVSWTDRAEAAAVVEMAGVEAWNCPEAVWDVEERLWPAFEGESVRQAVRWVVRELARVGYLSRNSFLALARPALVDHETRRAVRLFCRRMAVEVLERHLEGQGA